MTPIEIFIYAISAAILINLAIWLDDRAERKRSGEKENKKGVDEMGMKNGVRLDYRQESSDDTMARAKAECEFTDRLYSILMAYQERYHAVKRKPLKESERVGDLSLELSRLYNLIWSVALPLNDKARSKKKQEQEVI